MKRNAGKRKYEWWEILNKNLTSYCKTVRKFPSEDRNFICAFIVPNIVTDIVRRKLKGEIKVGI